MRFHVLALAAAAPLLGLTGVPAPAAAQDLEALWSECESQDAAAQLRACTAIIESGRARGNELATAYNNRGDAHALADDYPRAIADFSEAIRLSPGHAVVWGNRGSAHAQRGDLPRAIADLSEAIRLDPAFMEAYGLRGAFYEQQGDKVRALADLREAARLAPEHEGLRIALCRLLRANDAGEETRRVCASVE